MGVIKKTLNSSAFKLHKQMEMQRILKEVFGIEELRATFIDGRTKEENEQNWERLMDLIYKGIFFNDVIQRDPEFLKIWSKETKELK